MNVKRTQTLFINSAQRTSGEINDFNVHLLDQVIKAEDANTQIRVSCIHLSINRSYYTVEGLKLQINNITTGQTRTWPIANGYYDVNTFIVQVLSLLNLDPVDPIYIWRMTWQQSTNTYSIFPPNDNITYSLTFLPNTGHLFGFENGETVQFTYLRPLFSTKPILMNIDNSLFIRTNIPRRRNGAIDNLATSEFTESDILAVVPMVFSPFNTISIDTSNQFVFFLSVKEVTNFRLYVTDQNNNKLPLKYDWTIALKFEYLEVETQDELLTTLQEIRDLLKFVTLHKFIK